MATQEIVKTGQPGFRSGWDDLANALRNMNPLLRYFGAAAIVLVAYGEPRNGDDGLIATVVAVAAGTFLTLAFQGQDDVSDEHMVNAITGATSSERQERELAK